MDKRTNCLVYTFIQMQSSAEDLQSGLDFNLRKALKPNPKCLLTLSCFKCSIVSVRHKHVWSSQGLPLPPFIRSDQVGKVRVDGVLGRQHQALVWDEMGARCSLQRDRDIPFGELLLLSQVCLTVGIRGGDTAGPRRSFKRRVRGGLQPIRDRGWACFTQRVIVLGLARETFMILNSFLFVWREKAGLLL